MEKIWTPKDGTIDILSDGDKKYVEVKSKMGYPAIYPLHEVKIEKPIEAVLMDLDGTSVKSESFWIWIIQSTVARLIDNPNFELDDSDIPFVSGFSVSEHLQYCINKYCPEKTVEEARKHYFDITDYEMNEIMEGRGRANAFTPADGLKDFLYDLKSKDIKIGLVTSGLYRKAMPEIISAFNTLGMGDPVDFYDCIITAGYPLGKGQIGTLGELAPKPHPWLYAETMRVGLGIPFERRHRVIGIEDSTAGVISVLLSGVSPIGIAGGNIENSDIRRLCTEYVNDLSEVMKLII